MDNVELKNIIKENLIYFRKANKLTQAGLAEKIGYSDKAISRWETGEVVPDIETLNILAGVYNISISTFFEKNNKAHEEKKFKEVQGYRKLAMVLLWVINIWYITFLLYFRFQRVGIEGAWLVFIWAIPITFLFALIFNLKWGKKKWTLVFCSCLCWTLCLAFYLQFLKQNVYMIFASGIPIQIEIILGAYLKNTKTNVK